MGLNRTFLFCLAVLSVLPSFSNGFAHAEPPILRAGMETEPITLDWNAVRAPSDRFIVSFLMRGLLKYGPGNQPVCDLCTKFTVSPDGKSLDFELPAAQEWSDGEKLEARHFIDSFQRLLNPTNGFPSAPDYRLIVGAVQAGKGWDPKKLEVTAEGRTGLRIRLSEPSITFPHLLTRIAAYPIRKELTAQARADAGVAMASGPVLGPYQLAAWEKGRRIVIEGSAKFSGDRPVYRVDFTLGNHAGLLARFKKGLIDLLPNPNTEDLVALPGSNIQVNSYWATRAIVFNIRKGPASDSRVRRAILYSLDRSKLPALLKNGERAATGLIPPGLPGHRELPLVTQDHTRAASERVRLPSASPLTLKLILRSDEISKQVGTWVASGLSGIGIQIRLQPLSGSAYLKAWESGDFDAALHLWAFDIAFPADVLRAFETGSARNRGGWTHVGYDALLGQTERGQPLADPRNLLDEMTRILEVQDAAVIPLGYPTQAFLLGKRVMNFATTPFGDPDLLKIKLKAVR